MEPLSYNSLDHPWGENHLDSTATTTIPTEPSKQTSNPTDLSRFVLDEDGDLLIQCQKLEFLVSSKVLGLSSRRFRTMLKTRSAEQEGQTKHSPSEEEGFLVLALPDVDENAFKFLLHILHFSSAGCRALDLSLHLKVAQVAEEYECIKAVRGESRRLLPLREIPLYDTQSTWMVTAIAFLFDHEEIFESSTAKLASTLTEGELENHEDYSTVFPDHFRNRLSRTRRNLIQYLLSAIETSLDSIRDEKQAFKTTYLTCSKCYSRETRNSYCPTCRIPSVPLWCEASSRVAVLLEALDSVGLWPITAKLDSSASDIQRRVVGDDPPQVLKDHLKDHGCLLISDWKRLGHRLAKIIAGVKGLDIKIVKEE